MQSYVVGGAVRDYILGRPAHDMDYVLVNATSVDIQDMLDRGAKKVGIAFPVYILDGNQYSVACRNRSTATADNADNLHCVTLEEDLAGRDFTINSMAFDSDHHIIDPYNGVNDIFKRVIRHTSVSCFQDDPVRVLRAARQAADLDFTVDADTQQLMADAVRNGLLSSALLTASDRMWAETEKAIMTKNPSRYFKILDSVGALDVLFPELAILRDIPQPPDHHPEIWTLLHTYMVLDRAVELGADRESRFAALFHDLGKGLTPKDAYPQHIGHEAAGLPLLDSIRQRFPMPRSVYELSAAVMEHHLRVHVSMSISKPGKLVNLVRSIGGFRQNDDFFQGVLLACQSDAQGRAGFHDAPYPQADFLSRARQHLLAVKQSPEYAQLVSSGVSGLEFAEKLRILEIDAAQQFIKLHQQQADPTEKGRRLKMA